MNLLFPIAAGFAAATVTILFMEVCNSAFAITLSVRQIIESQVRCRASIRSTKYVTLIALAVQYAFGILVSYCYFFFIIYEFLSLNVLSALIFGMLTGSIGIFCYVVATRRSVLSNVLRCIMPGVILIAHVIQAFILFFIYDHLS